MNRIISLLTAIICFFSSQTGLFATQVETVNTITKIEDGFYMMDYTFDYDVDKMLKKGISTHVGLFAAGLANVLSGRNGFACTTFNSINENGETLLSRNFDYMSEYSQYMLVWTHPKNGYASLSSVSLGYFLYDENNTPNRDITGAFTLLAPYAPLDGINEKGLSIAVLELETAPTFQLSLKKDLTTTTMIRAVLDKAATVDEAIEIFRSHDMRDFLFGNCTYHYHIADASGKAVVIEYFKGKMKLIYPESRKGYDYMAATNFHLDKDAVDPDGMGYDRYDKVMNSLKSTSGKTSAKSAMKLLKATSVDEVDMHGYICSTLWSNVYNTKKKTVDICYFLDYGTTYTFSVAKPLKYTKK